MPGANGRPAQGPRGENGQRMERDPDALLPLPAVAYDACDTQAGRVISLLPVRYSTNGHSVPVAHGHRDILVRGYVDEVVTSCRSRSYSPAQPLLRAGRLRLRPDPLPAAAGAEGRCSGPGGAVAGMGVARRVRDAAASAGVPHGTSGKAGVCAGAQGAGNHLPKGGAGCGERRPPAGGHSASTR